MHVGRDVFGYMVVNSFGRSHRSLVSLGRGLRYIIYARYRVDPSPGMIFDRDVGMLESNDVSRLIVDSSVGISLPTDRE